MHRLERNVRKTNYLPESPHLVLAGVSLLRAEMGIPVLAHLSKDRPFRVIHQLLHGISRVLSPPGVRASGQKSGH